MRKATLMLRLKRTKAAWSTLSIACDRTCCSLWNTGVSGRPTFMKNLTRQTRSIWGLECSFDQLQGRVTCAAARGLAVVALSGPGIKQAETSLQSLPHHFQLVQSHKHFDPHLLVVPVGSLVDFPNKDPFFHNVFSLFDGKRFDLGLYAAGATRSVKFDRPGISFIFCNIHPQMSAVVVTMKTPYYGVTNKAGKVHISGVPDGRYQIQIWSERALPATLKNLSREVTIDEDTHSLGTFRIQASGDLLAHHKNKYGRDYDPVISVSPLYGEPE